MTTINWAQGKSGRWSSAKSWTGGKVPGAGDTAVIGAAATKDYTVTINSAVTVGTLELDNTLATLSLSNASLTTASLDILAGSLGVTNSSLSGTVTNAAGTSLSIGAGTSTFSNVTWRGALTQVTSDGNPLQLNNGFTLTSLDGTGPGTASFLAPVVLNDVSALNNATVGIAISLTVIGTQNLTFGNGFTLEMAVGSGANFDNTNVTNFGTFNTVNISGDGTFINDGLLEGVTGGENIFVNNGQVLVTGLTSLQASKGLTNNGTITVTVGAELGVSADNFGAAGANASIVLNGGELGFAGSSTADQLLAFYAAQNVTGMGAFGFAADLPDNTGGTLDIGIGTTLGLFEGGSISGGTIVDNSGIGPLGSASLADIVYQTTDPTVNFTGAFDNCTLAGVGTLNVTDYYSEAILNGTTITGVDDNGQVTVNEDSAVLLVTPEQVTAGYTVNLANASALELSGNGTFNDIAINVSGTGDMYGDPSGDIGGYGTMTLGPNFNATVAPRSIFGVDARSAYFDIAGTTVVNAGTLTATGGGTIALGVSLDGNSNGDGGAVTVLNNGSINLTDGELDVPFALTNTGVISVTGGTLGFFGSYYQAFTIAQIVLESADIAHNDSNEVVYGTLDLGGATITPGQGGVPDFGLRQNGYFGNSVVMDGTLALATGETFTDASSGPGGGGIELLAALANNGTFLLTGNGMSAVFASASSVTGNGVIELTGQTGSLTLQEAVGSGQTIALLGTNERLYLNSAVAETGFAGTLSGFSVGDSVEYYGHITRASFVGNAIVAKLSTGGTLSYATDTALHGTLQLHYINGVTIATYTSTTATANDWSAGTEGLAQSAPSYGQSHDFGWILQDQVPVALDQYMPHPVFA